MKDVTSNIQVGVATSGVYDLLGFNSVMAISTLTTAYSTEGIKVSESDDNSTFKDLTADNDSVIVRFDGDGKTAKIGYIGGKRYVKFAGGTVGTVLLVNPEVAPVGVTEGTADSTAATAEVTRMASAARQVNVNTN